MSLIIPQGNKKVRKTTALIGAKKCWQMWDADWENGVFDEDFEEYKRNETTAGESFNAWLKKKNIELSKNDYDYLLSEIDENWNEMSMMREIEKEEIEGEEWKKPLKERIREEMVIPSKEPISKTPVLEVVEKYTPEILNKYTEDEIFDIASGRKDATEEEVAQAKDVITRGIVANRLSMRKKAQEEDKY